MSIAVVDAGLAYQRRTFADFEEASIFSDRIRIDALADANLSAHAALMIPCRTPGHRLAPHRKMLDRYVREGGLLFVMGETSPDLFLNGLRFTLEPTNFWWWREPGLDLGVKVEKPSHPALLGLTDKDCAWHVHGIVSVPEGGEVLISWSPTSQVSANGAAGALMVDYPIGKGRVLVTSLDPIYHHGSGFMPATTRFLERFLPNAVAYAAGHKKAVGLPLGLKTA
ncbi:hypothetical protein ABWH92_12555 [Ahrensia marina]|uniref:hypothetical protein n=1 Tax=Ahrensia marina TaxID=1514904 RepID=UPI0035D00351